MHKTLIHKFLWCPQTKHNTIMKQNEMQPRISHAKQIPRIYIYPLGFHHFKNTPVQYHLDKKRKQTKPHLYFHNKGISFRQNLRL